MYKIILALPLVLVVLSMYLVLTGKKSEKVEDDIRGLITPIMTVIIVSLLFRHILIIKVLTSTTLIMVSLLLIGIIKSNGIPLIEDVYENTDCKKITKDTEKK